jgi:hypothetical protein
MSPPEAPTSGQLELIHLDRSSPSSVAVLLRLPEANARSFMVASALGRFCRHDGTFGEVRSIRDIGGSFIGPRQRGRVLQALGIKERRWRKLVTDWESRYVAHRCGPGGVVLFVRPLLDTCPVCNALIEITDTPPNPSARRKTGTNRTPETAPVVPPNGPNSAGGAVPTVPPVGTEPHTLFRGIS